MDESEHLQEIRTNELNSAISIEAVDIVLIAGCMS